MALVETPADFLSADEFAEQVVLDGVAVLAVFDLAYQRADVGSVGMASFTPALTLPMSAVPAGVVGKPVTARGIQYVVEESEPDGTGWTLLILRKA